MPTTRLTEKKWEIKNQFGSSEKLKVSMVVIKFINGILNCTECLIAY